MEIIWQRVPGCRACNRKCPTTKLGAMMSCCELMATCRAEPLTSVNISRRLAAVLKVLRSIALQTLMNSHSEQTRWWHRVFARDCWLWWSRLRALVAVHCQQEKQNHIWNQPRSSVLSGFNLSLFIAIQWFTSDMHISSRWIAIIMFWRRHCKYNWVSSAYESILMSCAAATSARSAMYKINRCGARTELCSTEQTVMTTDDVLLPYMTWNALSKRYELYHWRTTPQRPNWRSSRSMTW